MIKVIAVRKISIQKVFCLISILFIGVCCLFYGTRFVKLYLENEKEKKVEKNSLAKVIKESNEDNEKFKEIGNQLYFINDADNNYLMYSNVLWRIIKINDDNSIVAISDNSLTSLAYGKEVDYLDSYINKWLNKTDDEYSGILEGQLNNVSIYLQKGTICLDKVNKVDNSACNNTSNDYYFSLLSTVDFANIGNKNSYVVNDEYFYLNNTNNENQVWYITDEGKLTLNDGGNIIGIKPVITIKANIDYISGDGKIDNPYMIETDNGLFGSYVKLDNTMWRIYQVNDTEVRLVMNDYLKVNNQNLTYIYSNISSYHDDYKVNSIAYYLNHDFLNKLSYKNKIKEVLWTNGYYGDSSNYDYKTAINTTVNTKVALISMADIRLNNTLNNYFTMTGTTENGVTMYTIESNQKVYTKNIRSKSNVLPAISLEKSLLTKGKGTIDSPYEME